MCTSLPITDNRWVGPCAASSLLRAGPLWQVHRTTIARLVRAFVHWQVQRLERRIERFELECSLFR
jgi:hypothetical protein